LSREVSPGCFAQASAAESPDAARRGAEDLEWKARSAARREADAPKFFVFSFVITGYCLVDNLVLVDSGQW
jgi:hypothetical protein